MCAFILTLASKTPGMAQAALRTTGRPGGLLYLDRLTSKLVLAQAALVIFSLWVFFLELFGLSIAPGYNIGTTDASRRE